ncbi:MAG: GTP cyclohydrolase I FolE [SAR202 cluster bacterium]|jgi:GTP cyclohydrolase I|nr:MAG: GTP cyclohydrolase I FolE [SAR202 cluster bacterium]MCH2319338.1 GTP cyclohydrolase I FolE [SAR202 cluster bacterium]MQG74248.1 GTP cyclohydrolase I FolE [SAR202 cluster bacterium]|tara:strand:+ start:16924 stop:17526 length:603 start_codon:yes stop_codon:yes gene_type:complete
MKRSGFQQNPVTNVPLQSMMEAVKNMLIAIGENPEREGLKNTPKRVGEFYLDFFSGLNEDPKLELVTEFDENHYEPVIVTNIEFFSVCEHHLLPFVGYAHLGYIPSGKVVGVSKLVRVLDIFSRRPQIQERLADQVVDTIHNELVSDSTYVFLSAEHMCMTLRGVRKSGSHIVTSAERGDKAGLELIKSGISIDTLKGLE